MKKSLIIYLLMLIMATQVYSQTTVKGVVKSMKGELLTGVNVSIKHTTLGIITDVDGKFSLPIPADIPDPTLVFGYVGYVGQEIKIGNQSYLEVMMIEDTKQLNEVVVVGYGVQKKTDLTGAVSMVDGSKLDKFAVSGVDQALQGRAAGVSVTQNTGAPGDGVSIRIRGTGSIYSDNEPLYVIDGIPTKDPLALNSISPSEIESISILKDAASAAIYGSRANNGVVLVTTKKAKKGDSNIEFKIQTGIQTHGYLPQMVNTAQYVNIYNAAANNDNPYLPSFVQRPLISDAYAATLPDINHLKEIFRVAPTETYDLSFSGGNEKTNYNISGSYFNQAGIIYNSGFSRATGRANVNSVIKDWLTVNGNLNVYHTSTDIIASNGDGWGGNGSNPVRYAFFRTPAIATYDNAGNFIDLPEHPELFGDGYNPLGVAINTHNTKLDNGYNLKFNSIIKLSGDLSFITNAGMDFNTSNTRRFNENWGSNLRINNPNSLGVDNNYTSTWTVNNVLSYNKTFGKNHNISITAGEESIKSTSYDESSSVMNLTDQNMNLVYLSNGLGIRTSSEAKAGNALQSFFGRGNYDYKGKYFVSIVIREDGTSKFAPKNKWGTFYSGSLGWVISQENFFKDIKIIDRWKVRAGYGLNGNQDIPNWYAYTDKLSPQINYPFGGVVNNGYAPTQLGNANVKWETATQLDLGTDLSLFKGMFNITFDYFYKITHNMLVQQPLPPSVGYNYLNGNPWVNNGEILNRGLEIEVEHKRKIGDFGYDITVNISTLHNEVLQMNGAIIDQAFGFTRTEKGYPIGSFYMYKMVGIFQTPADIVKHAFQGNSLAATGQSGDIRPGDVMYADINGDGVINQQDMTHVGSPIPTLTGGFNLSCDYKGIDFSLFFQGAYGDKIYYQASRDIEGFYRPFAVTERYYENQWTGPGTSNTQPIASWSDSQNNTVTSTRFLQDGSYIRLKNLQIGYTLPTLWTQKAHISKVRVYFSGTNLYTLTKYTGLDPEMTTNNNIEPGQGVDIVRNVDWGTFPTAISYNLGIDIIF
jgi:TonB-linked SusC/RagA family outer membrane protein